jgi:hypothetical protein
MVQQCSICNGVARHAEKELLDNNSSESIKSGSRASLCIWRLTFDCAQARTGVLSPSSLLRRARKRTMVVVLPVPGGPCTEGGGGVQAGHALYIRCIQDETCTSPAWRKGGKQAW